MALTKAIYSIVEGAPANILAFGADPTGAVDSSAAILAAINSFPSNQIAYVVPPDHEYSGICQAGQPPATDNKSAFSRSPRAAHVYLAANSKALHPIAAARDESDEISAIAFARLFGSPGVAH